MPEENVNNNNEQVNEAAEKPEEGKDNTPTIEELMTNQMMSRRYE